MATNWQRRFPDPIHLADGTVLRTLRHAADWIIEHDPPNSRAAIERLMDAAERGGDLDAARTAVRVALLTKLDFGRRR